MQSSSARCSVRIQYRMPRLRVENWFATFFSSRENSYTLFGRLEGHSGPINYIDTVYRLGEMARLLPVVVSFLSGGGR